MIHAPGRFAHPRGPRNTPRGHFCALAAAGLLAGLGAASAATLTAGVAAAQGSNHCALYGAGVVDIGDGTCARVIRQQYDEAASQHVRVDLGSRAAAGDARAWTSGGTANAALRSDGLGMLPGAVDAQHLRVPNGLYGR